MPLDPHLEIGSIAWIATEGTSGEVVSEGHRTYRAADVELSEPRSGKKVGLMYRKKVRLDDVFSFEMVETPSGGPNDMKGFGLTSAQKGEVRFCWEWFDVVAPGRAKKLQEGGELAIEVAPARLGWEVVKTEFLTDISIRLFNMGLPFDLEKPLWRVRILKGSTMRWPSQ